MNWVGRFWKICRRPEIFWPKRCASISRKALRKALSGGRADRIEPAWWRIAGFLCLTKRLMFHKTTHHHGDMLLSTITAFGRLWALHFYKTSGIVDMSDRWWIDRKRRASGWITWRLLTLMWRICRFIHLILPRRALEQSFSDRLKDHEASANCSEERKKASGEIAESGFGKSTGKLKVVEYFDFIRHLKVSLWIKSAGSLNFGPNEVICTVCFIFCSETGNLECGNRS